ncbi:MAG: TM2 domain-containing protein [Lachnospiraceae bacterium]|nr:TM2 domain-containing protein [Lachnospiraceae bacterium]
MGNKDRVAAGLLAIFVGGIGIHKFYLGYNKEGIITLVISLATCGVGAGVMSIIGLIEGIIYLTKSDDEFRYTYVDGYKGWF